MKKLLNISIIITSLVFCAGEVYAAVSGHQTRIPYPIVKFLSAMLGVLISVLAIWIGLKIYKKFILKDYSKSNEIDYNKTLESPKDFKEAINLFLDKTDKN